MPMAWRGHARQAKSQHAHPKLWAWHLNCFRATRSDRFRSGAVNWLFRHRAITRPKFANHSESFQALRSLIDPGGIASISRWTKAMRSPPVRTLDKYPGGIAAVSRLAAAAIPPGSRKETEAKAMTRNNGCDPSGIKNRMIAPHGIGISIGSRPIGGALPVSQ